MAELKEVPLRRLAVITRYWRRVPKLVMCSVVARIVYLYKINRYIPRLVDMSVCNQVQCQCVGSEYVSLYRIEW